MKPVIIYPPTIDWDYLHQRPQQLFKALAELGCTCIFGNINRDNRYSDGFVSLRENLILANGYDFGSAVKWARANFPNRPVIAYYTYPGHITDLLSTRVDLIIFDFIDEPVREFAGFLQGYSRAVSEADVVLATARSIMDRVYSVNNKEVYLLPNGCDYEHFKNAQAKQGLDCIPFSWGKPVIGYIGAIAPWLDMELINTMAHFMPEYEFVFIGPLFAQRWAAFPHCNMHYLHYKEYHELPRHLSNFDYCLIPFVINEMTRGVNPVKYWEYLASGIPILSTPLPEVDRRYVTIITKDMFPGFSPGDIERGRAERIRLAQGNSWSARAKKVLDIIRHKLECG